MSDVKTDALLKIRAMTAEYFKSGVPQVNAREVVRVMLEIEMAATTALLPQQGEKQNG